MDVTLLDTQLETKCLLGWRLCENVPSHLKRANLESEAVSERNAGISLRLILNPCCARLAPQRVFTQPRWLAAIQPT